MGAPDLLARLQALGIRLARDGDALIAEPKSALTEEARTMIRAHKAELLAALQRPPAAGAREQAGMSPLPPPSAVDDRKARALAFLEANPNVRRACFADTQTDPAHIFLTVAIREPWAAVELVVERSRFDAMALFDLSLRYPDTTLFVPEH